jgi:NTP pyrophosphatase (non-canonical NTP hydrolase)
MTTDPTTIGLYGAVRDTANWLDEHNGADRAELAARILKLVEEAGEAAAAWIGATGQNPRKGTTHTYADVAAELADAAFTALVAIESLGHDPAALMASCAAKVSTRVAPAMVRS